MDIVSLQIPSDKMDSCSKISQYLLYSIDYDKIGGKPTQEPQGVAGLQSKGLIALSTKFLGRGGAQQSTYTME